MIKIRPAIIGVGRTSFGEHYEEEPQKLMDEAGIAALDSANISRKDIDACYCSDYFLQLTNKIGLEEGFLSELLELHIPMEKLRSFGSALLNACCAIKSGKYDIILVSGVEKMCDRWSKIRDDLMLLEDPWSYYAGCTPEANHELLLREYIRKYHIKGGELEKFNVALAQIAVKNHYNATKNKYAQYRRPIKLEAVLAKRSKGKPLGLYDFAPISDGATALILANPEKIDAGSVDLVYVEGSSSSTDYITFSSREVRTGFLASQTAMNRALEEAGISQRDIQLAELYDQSTILELVSLEDLGFAEPGKAWMDVYNSCEDYKGYYEINGQIIFVNTNGGLKADGNPLGATGGAQFFEVFQQLRGEAGERQIDVDGDLEYACVSELEGFGTKSYIHILRRE